MGNPKGTKSFSSWSEFTDFVNEMPIKTIQPFVSNFNAFAGEGFYGNVVQGLVIKQLEDAVFIFGIAIDGTLIFRKRNYLYLANLHTSFLCNLIYPTFSRILLYSC